MTPADISDPLRQFTNRRIRGISRSVQPSSNHSSHLSSGSAWRNMAGRWSARSPPKPSLRPSKALDTGAEIPRGQLSVIMRRASVDPSASATSFIPRMNPAVCQVGPTTTWPGVCDAPNCSRAGCITLWLSCSCDWFISRTRASSAPIVRRRFRTSIGFNRESSSTGSLLLNTCICSASLRSNVRILCCSNITRQTIRAPS